MPHGTLGGSLGTWRYDAYSAARFASRSRYCFGLQAGRIRESRATVADNAANVRLWHDDIRPAPEGWLWARENHDAMAVLATGVVCEISLDHDLGLHGFTEEQIEENPELLFGRGTSEHTGMDLVLWMIASDCVPPKVTIHSWNPEATKRMAQALNDAGHDVLVKPYTVPGTVILDA